MKKEILSTKRQMAFYQQCYERLGYTVQSVEKSGQNQVLTVERSTPQSDSWNAAWSKSCG